MSEQRGGLTLADLERFLGPGVRADDDVQPYLSAAAVLVAFDPARLRPAGAPPPTDADPVVAGLLPLCEPVTSGPARGLWSLSSTDRRAALRRLGTREAMLSALAVNPERPHLVQQRVLERVLEGTPVDLALATRAELSALLAVLPWFDGVLPDLVAVDAVAEAIGDLDRLAPLRRLAGRSFVGRTHELERLRRLLAEPSHGGSRPSLFVHGPGGVGKSTLLARFLLTQVEAAHLPWVYLDVDRPTLRPQHPATFLLDALDQLRPQLPLDPRFAASVATELEFAIGREDDSRFYESPSVSGGAEVQLLSGLLSPALGATPLVVVVDTFEEAQFLGSDVVWTLVQVLLDLAGSVPNVRLVLSGRALPPEYVHQALPGGPGDDAVPGSVDLGLLDPESAGLLLASAVADEGLPPLGAQDVTDVLAVVSRNPMCIRLAARVLRAEGVDALRDGRAQLLTRLRAEKIQALLYGRVLRHLHSEDARAIAFPGLVVRRITPEVVREVLSGPCELHLRPGHDEHDVVGALRAETGLVEVDPLNGSLRHRADVRRAMLEDLTESVDADVVRRIDEAAVAYYARRDDEVARAEEIYHRLRLGQPDDVLDARWRSDAAPHLKGAGEELAPRQRLWLARRLHVTVDESVRRGADQQDWEDQAARTAGRYLRAGTADRALAVLRERTSREPRSRLWFLEAEALRVLDRPDEALRVARRGVDAASAAGAIDLPLELLLQMVVVEEGRGALTSARTLLAEAREVAAHSANRFLRLRVAVTELRLHRRLEPEASDERAALRARVLADVTDEMLLALRGEPVLLREVAAELGKADPRVAAAAIETLGVDVTTDEQARRFGHAVVVLDEMAAAAIEPTLRDGAEHVRRADFDADAVREWAARNVTVEDVHDLGATLAGATPGDELLGSFREYFRAGVESSLRGLPGDAASWSEPPTTGGASPARPS